MNNHVLDLCLHADAVVIFPIGRSNEVGIKNRFVLIKHEGRPVALAVFRSVTEQAGVDRGCLLEHHLSSVKLTRSV